MKKVKFFIPTLAVVICSCDNNATVFGQNGEKLEFLNALNNRNFDKIIELCANKNFPIDIINDTTSTYHGETGFNALLSAIVNQKSEAVNALLACNGLNIDCVDQDETTPLMYAAHLNNFEIVKELIAKGANVDLQDKYKKTALMFGLEANCDKKIIDLLCTENNVDLQDENGRTALMYAVKSQEQFIEDKKQIRIYKSRIESIKTELKKEEKDKNKKDRLNTEKSEIEKCLNTLENEDKAKRDKNIEIMRTLINAGADPKIKDNSCSSILHYAVKSQNEDIFEILPKDFDLNPLDRLGRTPLFLAAELNNIEFGKILGEKCVEQNISIDTPNFKGYTPLMIAAEKGYPLMTECLAVNSADINALDFCKETSLFKAVKNSNKDIVKLLIFYKADVDISNERGETPLTLAIEKGNKEIFDLLISENAVSDSVDILGNTPLFKIWNSINNLAISPKHENFYEIPSKTETGKLKGEQENFVDLWCENIKHIIDVLKSKGANVKAQNKEGNTPLHIVCQIFARLDKENKKKIKPFFDDTVKSLKDAKNIKNKAGKKPLELLP